LSTGDPAAAAKFYTGLFGWKLDPGKDDYQHIVNGEAFIGGIQSSAHRNPNAPPHWLSYFEVSDCDAKTAQTQSMGGSIYLAPMSMENVGRFSVVTDPQGAVFSLFQPAPRSK